VLLSPGVVGDSDRQREVGMKSGGTSAVDATTGAPASMFRFWVEEYAGIFRWSGGTHCAE
jgi:hypothetical protein